MSVEVTEAQRRQLDAFFTYHAPGQSDLPKFSAIREAAYAFAEVLLANTPSCADQTTAIRCVREAVAWANAAIAIKFDAPPPASPSLHLVATTPARDADGQNRHF